MTGSLFHPPTKGWRAYCRNPDCHRQITLSKPIDFTAPPMCEKCGESMNFANLDPPAQRHSDTSVAAADAIKPKAGTLRSRVHIHLTGCADGATDEEMQSALLMNPSTQRPRRIELEAAGLVRDSGLRRRTRSGRKATVWEAT